MRGQLHHNIQHKKAAGALLHRGVLIIFILTQSGCALLELPFRMVGGVLQIIRKLPKPPPGVF